MPAIKRRALLSTAAAFALAVPAAAQPAAAPATATLPTVRLLPGTPLLPLSPFDPAAADYVVEEYEISGTATSYQKRAEPDAQGNWKVAAATTAPYVTRIVVLRPAHAANWNGSVMVEWLNVSSGDDRAPLWAVTRRELLRGRSAYVAVSAQHIGIEGGTTIFGLPAKGLKHLDPQRYGGLSHPGDAFSFDMFSQVGELLTGKNAGGVLGPLVLPRHVIGMGLSQSAAYLTTYVNAVDPLARRFDGFLICSRFRGCAALDGSGMMQQGKLPPVKMGSDLRVPTQIVETETDLLGPFGYYDARQPDTKRLRVWEIPGASHADIYLFSVAAVDTGSAPAAVLAAAYAPRNVAYGAKLDKDFNNGPQSHYITESAVAHLQKWVATGQAPPHAQPIQMIPTNLPKLPVRPVLDANGNALGGVRSPWVDVPLERLAGYGNSGSPVAFLVGVATPFDAAQLAQLYPGGQPEYLHRFTIALDKTIAAGFILPADRQEILDVAALSYPTT